MPYLRTYLPFTIWHEPEEPPTVMFYGAEQESPPPPSDGLSYVTITRGSIQEVVVHHLPKRFAYLGLMKQTCRHHWPNLRFIVKVQHPVLGKGRMSTGDTTRIEWESGRETLGWDGDLEPERHTPPGPVTPSV